MGNRWFDGGKPTREMEAIAERRKAGESLRSLGRDYGISYERVRVLLKALQESQSIVSVNGADAQGS